MRVEGGLADGSIFSLAIGVHLFRREKDKSLILTKLPQNRCDKPFGF